MKRNLQPWRLKYKPSASDDGIVSEGGDLSLSNEPLTRLSPNATPNSTEPSTSLAPTSASISTEPSISLAPNGTEPSQSGSEQNAVTFNLIPPDVNNQSQMSQVCEGEAFHNSPPQMINLETSGLRQSEKICDLKDETKPHKIISRIQADSNPEAFEKQKFTMQYGTIISAH